jgi:hypothetical protein
MKGLQYLGLAVALGVGIASVGCEWESSGDENSWNSDFNARYEWVDFSGVYRAEGENGYLVKSYAPPSTSAASLDSWSESIGTGSNFFSSFSATLSHIPVTPGSIVVSDGFESFLDTDGDGLLVGDHGGTGSINYDTGIIQVSFNSAPAPGQSIIVDYQYYVPGSSENPQPGSTDPIYTFLITQDADQLTFRDNYGDLYYGRITFVEGTGGDDSGAVAGDVNATFEVKGNGIWISGTLTGTYTPGAVQADGATRSGTLKSRSIRGTWMEHDGTTGDIIGIADTPATVTVSTGSGTNSVAQ